MSETGLNIDMLAADRLREWARLLLVHGSDISYWGSVSHVVSKLQITATDIEHAVRDLGVLRAEVTSLRAELEQRSREAFRAGFCAHPVNAADEPWRWGFESSFADDRWPSAYEAWVASTPPLWSAE